MDNNKKLDFRRAQGWVCVKYVQLGYHGEDLSTLRRSVKQMWTVRFNNDFGNMSQAEFFKHWEQWLTDPDGHKSYFSLEV